MRSAMFTRRDRGFNEACKRLSASLSRWMHQVRVSVCVQISPKTPSLDQRSADMLLLLGFMCFFALLMLSADG